jgi:3-deoxy-D-manno-octulosonic-acid transferase
LAVFFYNIFLLLYRAAVWLASAWNEKARKWRAGRKNIFETIRSSMQNVTSPVMWMHCASLGEFEQGRPVIEKIKKQIPGCTLIVTFFSPSGYEIKKNYAGADHVFYLPVDSKRNARKFLDIVNPSLVVFVKYDYWYYYLHEIKQRKINCLLISAVFREEQSFFKWYGGLQRKMLCCFTHLFVQDEGSKILLRNIGLDNCTVSGDTRFDRVAEIAEKFEPVPLIEEFIDKKKVIVAGSTWKEDEEIIARYIHDRDPSTAVEDYRWIIAPHEINEKHISELKKLFTNCILYSELEKNYNKEKKVLIIDCIGLLSRLYYYATVVYVGGGFGKAGVHNVLEAAVYGRPVLFGPIYYQFLEAKELIEKGGAMSIANYDDFESGINNLSLREDMSRKSKEYVYAKKGAAEKILQYIQENRLLTS